ncbi:Major facilitator superfamily domain general substrate transporter [Lasiodiplodia theobromae]|nr:Major facilitator superfamily domain general substrate transporter [Lasiodiplodia theobromae]
MHHDSHGTATRPSVESDNVELGWLDARDDEPFLPDARRSDEDGDGIPRNATAEEKTRKPRVIWLTVFFLISSLSFGIAVVPRMNLIVSLICRQTLQGDFDPVVIGGYNRQCQVDAVSAHTAMVQSAGNVISGVLSAAVAAFLNVLSDRVGRVPIIAYTATVLAAVEVVLVLLAKAPSTTSYRWLYLAYTLDGLSGSFATVMAMSSAYISDCVAEEKRNVQVGRMHGAMFIGIAVGPAMSSGIVAGSGQKSPLLVFYLGLAMRAISLVYLPLFVAESLPHARKGLAGAFPVFSRARWQQITKPARGLDAILIKLRKLSPRKWLDRLVPPSSPGSRRLRRNVVLLLAINLICYIAAMATSDILILYPQVVFKWGNVENNMFMSVINGFRAVVSTLGIPVLIFFFQRRRSPALPLDSTPIPHTTPTPAPPQPTTSPTSPAMLDPSAFPDLDALTSPTTPISPYQPHQHPNDESAMPPPPPPPPANQDTLDPLDRTLIVTAILFDIFGYLGYAASPNGILFTLCGAAAAFGAVGLSTSEAALTKIVAPSSSSSAGTSPSQARTARAMREEAMAGGGSSSRVGELMAGLGLLQSVVRIVAPAVVNAVYGATVAVGAPGTAFVGVAGVLGVGAALTWGLVVG